MFGNQIFTFTFLIAEFAQFEEEATILKKELESTEGKKAAQAKALEKSNKLIKQEREDLQRELQELQDRTKQQTKELREALQQRKMAMDEFTDINEKLVGEYSYLLIK